MPTCEPMTLQIHEVSRCADRLIEIEAWHAMADAAVPSGAASSFDRGLVTLWFWIAFGSLLVLGAAGCGPRAAPHQRSAISPSSHPIAEATQPPVSTAHNWQYRDGQEYAYLGGLSEDQKKTGQTRPIVRMYRYLGEHDGVFELQFDGETATCANPCQTINIHAGPFHVERLDFDPNTLIGAAFTDAFNGQMDIYSPAKRTTATGDGGPH